MGLFDKPQFSDGSLRELRGVAFTLVGVGTRDVTTKYGEREAIDLTLEIEGERYTFSGFSAGILQQVRNAREEDFPVVCTIEEIPLKSGNSTTGLTPLGDSIPDDMPWVSAPSRDIPLEGTASDDDIPF